MIRPEFVGITLALLIFALIFRPKNLWARFFIRQILTMTMVALWGCNAGFYTASWGVKGPLYDIFVAFVLPILVTLHPGRVWKSALVIYATFCLVAYMTIGRESKEVVDVWAYLRGIILEGFLWMAPCVYFIGWMRKLAEESNENNSVRR